MSKPPRDDETSVDPQLLRARRMLFLLLFLIANAGLVVAFAAPNLTGSSADGITGRFLYIDQIFFESIVLLIPFLALSVLGCLFFPRLGFWLGLATMGGFPAWYYLNQLMVRRTGIPLFSSKAVELLRPILDDLPKYILNIDQFLVHIGAFLLLQVAFFAIARWLSAQLSTPRARRRIATLAVGLIVVSSAHFAFAISSQQEFLVLGSAPPFYVNVKPQPWPTPLERKVIAQVVASDARIDDFVHRYEMLHVSNSAASQPKSGKQRPDVLIVLVESFRPSGISTKSAPNLSKFGAHCRKSSYHLSSGNGTHLGYFGILYGINALWYDRALDHNSGMSPALPRIMQEVGYTNVFVGSWPVEGTNQMQRFVSAPFFPLQETRTETMFYDGDRGSIQRTIDLLERRGDYESLRDTPLFIVLQCNTTHWNYPCEPVDELFTPTLHNPLIPPAHDDLETRKRFENRYRNAVHCLDRLLGPLLEVVRAKDILTVITGDHGESLAEDGSVSHCTALTEAQVRTPLYVFAPSQKPDDFPAVTCHLDIAPTILGLLGLEVNDRALLYGRDLWDAKLGQQPTPLVLRGCTYDDRVLLSLGMTPETPWFGFSGNPFESTFRLSGLLLNRGRAEVFEPNVSSDQIAPLLEQMLSQLLAVKVEPLPKDPVAAILAALPGFSAAKQRAILEGLGAFGPTGVDAIGVLERYAQSPDREMRKSAERSLSRLRRFEPVEFAPENISPKE